jgi:hypothetical protein
VVKLVVRKPLFGKNPWRPRRDLNPCYRRERWWESRPRASKPCRIVGSCFRLRTSHPRLSRPVAVKLAVGTSGVWTWLECGTFSFTGKAITPSLLDHLAPVARGVERAADNTPAQLDIYWAVAALLVVKGTPISVRIRVQIRLVPLCPRFSRPLQKTRKW